MEPLPKGRILDTLLNGEMGQVGLVPWGSNYTFLVKICLGPDEIEAIYKPRKGERPLWDFPQGTLSHRERAAFLVSEALGWEIVPPTVLRDGIHGYGSVQYFVEHDPDIHYFSLTGGYTEQLQQITLFDCLINNADRKGGHILLDKNGKLWSIDHGICFHSDHKLRTVVWDFAGKPIPANRLDDLKRLQDMLAGEPHGQLQELTSLLSKREITALEHRAGRLVSSALFPVPGPGRHYPWPPV